MRIVLVDNLGRVYEDHGVRSVEWFSTGSSYLREPHWHVRHESGFRTNIPRRYYCLHGPYPCC